METAKLSADLLATKGQAYATGATGFYRKPSVSQLFQLQSHNSAAPKTSNRETRRIRKSLLLNNSAHNRLRMLAAKLGMSQQQLMEAAVESMLKQARDENGCVCKMD